LSDERDDALRLMARLSYPSIYNAEAERLGLEEGAYQLLGAFYDHGAEVIDRLGATGALKTMPQPLFGEQVGDVDWAVPEYHADLLENKSPYGRTLLPEFDLMSGVLGGAEIVNQLSAYVVAGGGTVLVRHRAVGLLTEDDRVVGVVAVDDAGQTVEVRAADGVIFGSGGFTHHREKLLGYLRGPIFGGCAVPTNTGDFLDIAAEVGAATGNLSNAFWSQSVLEQTLPSGQVAWDEDVFIPFGDSMVIVNKYGERIGSEKVVYHERTQTHFVFDPQRRESPNAIQFMIWDSAVADYEPWHMYRYPVPVAGESAPWVMRGATWDELSAQIEERLRKLDGRGSGSTVISDIRLAPDFADQLRATVDRFDSFAADGVDRDFGRGSTPIQHSWGSVPRADGRANPTMRPFAEAGPYYCAMLCAGTLDTCGGPVIDDHGQVLRPDGSPIEGLYAAGNCAASVTGQAYWSAGSTLGPAITFGYRAGRACSGRHAQGGQNDGQG
jgi:hypothetical protein